MRRDLLISIVLALFIALLGVSWFLGARATHARIQAARRLDPLYGHPMPCGDRYAGETTMINGLLYYVCERGHPFAKQSNADQIDAKRPSPLRPLPR